MRSHILFIMYFTLYFFQEKPSLCRNEQVCQGRKSVKRFERSNGLKTHLIFSTLYVIQLLVANYIHLYMYKDALTFPLDGAEDTEGTDPVGLHAGGEGEKHLEGVGVNDVDVGVVAIAHESHVTAVHHLIRLKQ